MGLHNSICLTDSFVFIYVNFKAKRYESASFNYIVADKSHCVALALLISCFLGHICPTLRGLREGLSSCFVWSNRSHFFKLGLHNAICLTDSFVFIAGHYCVNFKSMRYESTSLKPTNRIVQP